MFKCLVILTGVLVFTMPVLAQKSKYMYTPKTVQQFFDIINKYREVEGSAPLVIDHSLDTLAKRRISRFMALYDTLDMNEFDKNYVEYMHSGYKDDIIWFNKITPDTICARSECAADLHMYSGSDTSAILERLINGWKNSKPHWYSMLDPDFKFSTLYWTVDGNHIVAYLMLIDLRKVHNN